MRYILLFLTGILLFAAGCSGRQDSREQLAAAVVEAIADGEEDDLWKLLSPDMREKTVEKFGKSEEETRETLMDVMQEKLKEKYGISDLDELEDDGELFQRICGDMLRGEEKMINIDGKWYVNLL